MMTVEQMANHLRELVDNGQGSRFIAWVDCVTQPKARKVKMDAISLFDDPAPLRTKAVKFNFRLKPEVPIVSLGNRRPAIPGDVLGANEMPPSPIPGNNCSIEVVPILAGESYASPENSLPIITAIQVG